jgi:FkbM family methyltransferase
MKNNKFNKRLVTTVRYIYNLGILKSMAILFAILLSGEEFEIKWKGQILKLRKHSTDFNVFRQIQVFGQYNIRSLEKIPVHTIVDLGANIGMSVLFFKSKYPEAQIIAVEPEQNNYRLLKKNVNGDPRTYVLNNAIWSSSRELGLYDNGSGEYGYLVGEQKADEIGTIRAITIGDIIEKYRLSRIDILKIDIEGSEKELFSGDCSAWLPKVGCIIIELHDWFREGCAYAFFKAISDYPYNLSFKGENIIVLFNEKERNNAPPTG